jgi:hypothetical protein
MIASLACFTMRKKNEKVRARETDNIVNHIRHIRRTYFGKIESCFSSLQIGRRSRWRNRRNSRTREVERLPNGPEVSGIDGLTRRMYLSKLWYGTGADGGKTWWCNLDEAEEEKEKNLIMQESVTLPQVPAALHTKSSSGTKTNRFLPFVPFLMSETAKLHIFL